MGTGNEQGSTGSNGKSRADLGTGKYRTRSGIPVDAFKSTSHKERVLVEDFATVGELIEILKSPDDTGVIKFLTKAVDEALDYAGGFSPFETLHVSVEVMDREKNDKVRKQTFEYRKPLAGQERAQVIDLLNKLPAMTQKLAKHADKHKRVRFGFHYGLVHTFDVPVEIAPKLSEPESAN